ncbi:MAG: c-type cytochrome domain-containing protein [Planctomycetota bacterium]
MSFRRLAAIGYVLIVAFPAFADPSEFTSRTQPLVRKYCHRCHNADNRESGIRVDTLADSIDESQVKHWQHVRDQISDGWMPPEDEPQPSDAERSYLVDWLDRALQKAKERPREASIHR